MDTMMDMLDNVAIQRIATAINSNGPTVALDEIRCVLTERDQILRAARRLNYAMAEFQDPRLRAERLERQARIRQAREELRATK